MIEFLEYLIGEFYIYDYRINMSNNVCTIFLTKKNFLTFRYINNSIKIYNLLGFNSNASNYEDLFCDIMAVNKYLTTK